MAATGRPNTRLVENEHHHGRARDGQPRRRCRRRYVRLTSKSSVDLVPGEHRWRRGTADTLRVGVGLRASLSSIPFGAGHYTPARSGLRVCLQREFSPWRRQPRHDGRDHQRGDRQLGDNGLLQGDWLQRRLVRESSSTPGQRAKIISRFWERRRRHDHWLSRKDNAFKGGPGVDTLGGGRGNDLFNLESDTFVG